MSNTSTERKWDREEVVILVVEYFRTKNLSSDEINKTHQEISDFLRRREEVLTDPAALIAEADRIYDKYGRDQ